MPNTKYVNIKAFFKVYHKYIEMRFPSNRTLGKICVYGAVASISAVMFMKYKYEERIRNADFFRLAMKTLRAHRGAVSLLGEPIKEMGFDLTNKSNQCNAHMAHFEVNVKGPKERGKIYFWATNTQENGWLLDRLDLELKSQPDKRYLLKKQDTDQQFTNDFMDIATETSN